MSLLGFNAIGRRALGEVSSVLNITLTAQASSYAMTGIAVAFKISEASAPGSFSIVAPNAPGKLSVRGAAGSFSQTGAASTFNLAENTSAGSYVITGAIANNLNGAADPGVFHLASIDTALIWTGAGVDTSYTGGVGHFLEEMERVKRLKAITRKIPAPIDRRTMPRFEPLRGPPSAPAAPAPDMAAIQNQRATEAAAQAARAKKRRRDEEAVLLLAS